VAGGPRVGDLEAGVVANAFGNTASIVSGGLACIVGALVVARLLPGFRHQHVPPGVTAALDVDEVLGSDEADDAAPEAVS